MSSSEDVKKDRKVVNRTLRCFFRADVKVVHEIKTRLALHGALLDRYNVTQVKFMITDLCGEATIALFSLKQLYYYNWADIVKTIFGLELEKRTANDISRAVTFLESNAATVVIDRPILAQSVYRQPRIHEYTTAMRENVVIQPPPPPLMMEPLDTASAASFQDTEPAVNFCKGSQEAQSGDGARVVLPIAISESQEVSAAVGSKRLQESPPLIQDPLFEVRDAEENIAAIHELIKAYLTNGHSSIPTEPKYPTSFDKSDLSALSKMRESCNKPPFSEIKDKLPRVCVKSPTEMNKCLRQLDPEHRKSIEFINKSLRVGLTAYFPFPVHIYTDYGASKSSSSPAFLIEFHRRILALENGLSTMANYVRSIYDQKKLRTSGQVPVNLQNRLMIILKMGCGLGGSGSDFFKSPTIDRKMISEKLATFTVDQLSGEDKAMYDLVDWLAKNRGDCLTRASLAFTGHCFSVVPALLSIGLHAEDFFKLNDPGVAKSLAAKLKSVAAEMELLCKSEVDPLVKYGAMLSVFYKAVFQTCSDFYKQIKHIISIPLPLDIALSKIDFDLEKRGVILETYGHTVLGGHLKFWISGQHYLIPFHASYKDVAFNNLGQRQAAADRYHQWRRGVIDKYVAEFIPEESYDTLMTLELMEEGDKKVLRWFNDDSHVAKLTSKLFPTPSMMSARQSFLCPFE